MSVGSFTPLLLRRKKTGTQKTKPEGVELIFSFCKAQGIFQELV